MSVNFSHPLWVAERLDRDSYKGLGAIDVAELSHRSLVYLSPFVATRVAAVELGFSGALFPRGQLDVGGTTFGANCVVDIQLQSVYNVA